MCDAARFPAPPALGDHHPVFLCMRRAEDKGGTPARFIGNPRVNRDRRPHDQGTSTAASTTPIARVPRSRSTSS
jgi:hypothetical protein